MTGTAPGPLSGTLVVDITLDLEAEDDRQLLLDLVRRADVLVENLRTGVLDRLGLCFEALHPLNPGSDTTVRRGGSGYDQIAQGEAGLMSLTGSGPDDPEKVGTPIADLLAGMDGAYPFQSTRWTIAGEVGRAQGNHHASIAPYGPFHCADGSAQIASGARGCGAGSVQVSTSTPPHRVWRRTNTASPTGTGSSTG